MKILAASSAKARSSNEVMFEPRRLRSNNYFFFVGIYPDRYTKVPLEMFATENDRMLCEAAVARKLEEYRKSDLRERNKRGDKPTIELEEAMALIEASKGICGCCGCDMIMHSWPRREYGVPPVFSPGFNKQFSFDRIDDNGTHSADNLQVVCLECNITSADAVYNPDYDILVENGSLRTAYEEYEYMKVQFNVFEDTCIKGRDSKLISGEVWNYHRKLKSYLAYLHDRIYGTRKPNNWKRFRVVARNCYHELAPGCGYIMLKNGSCVPYKRVNFDYFVRERAAARGAKRAAERAAIRAMDLDEDEIAALEATVEEPGLDELEMASWEYSVSFGNLR